MSQVGHEHGGAHVLSHLHMVRCSVIGSKRANELNQMFAEELNISARYWQNTEKVQWESPIDHLKLGEYVIVSLNTRRKVKSEGYLMQNCVRQYIDVCQGGEYLLFSIRKHDSERAATIGVKNRDDHWYLDNCLGKNNATVMEIVKESLDSDGNAIQDVDYTELFSIAHEVVRLLNYASSIRNAA